MLCGRKEEADNKGTHRMLVVKRADDNQGEMRVSGVPEDVSFVWRSCCLLLWNVAAKAAGKPRWVPERRSKPGAVLT